MTATAPESTSYSHSATAGPGSRQRKWIIVGAAIAVIAALTAVLAITFSGSSTPTFTAHGSVAVEGATIRGTTCDTSDSISFSDVNTGVAVRITDPGGKGVGTAVLGVGRYDRADQLCVFSWATKVPADLSSYSVAISHRGTLVYTKSELQRGVHSSLTAGDLP